MRKPLIAGNWKMYKTPAEAAAFAEEFKAVYEPSDVKVVIAAPYIDLPVLAQAFAGTAVEISAQNMHFEDEGAFTGEVSAKMLKAAGVSYTIIGHSERREYFAETDESVNLKIRKALAEGITPILCVGEKLEVREKGEEELFVQTQLEKDLAQIPPEQAEKLVIAYEPIWAIGTGKTASPQQAQDMCAFIRRTLCGLYGSAVSENIAVLYGGSVKPSNASQILEGEDIDGALVGGASLKASDFMEIINF